MQKPITTSTCIFTASPDDEAGLIRHFEMAQEAGFSGFELCTLYDHAATLHRAAVKAGAKVIAVHGLLDGNSCSPDASLRKASVEKAARFLAEFAEYAPCPIVEHYHHRFNDPAYGQYFRDSVEQLLAETDKMNFIFCMENAPYKPESNERYPDVAEIAEFVRSFGEKRMFITLDVNHANLHEDPIEVCRISAGLVRHIHVSDNQGHREQHLLPGDGIIDFTAVLGALYDNGYSGPCNMESHFPKDSKVDITSYRKLYDYMKNLPI